MTISADYVPNIDLGNGVTAVFAVNFPFGAQADLRVTLFNSATGANVSPAPVLNGAGTYDYTVSGTADPDTGIYPNGSITFNTAPAAGLKVVRERVTPQRQNTSLTNNGPFPAKTVEGSFDREELQLQERSDALSRAVISPASDGAKNMVLPAASLRANQILGFNASAEPVAASALQLVDSSVGTVATLLLAAATLFLSAQTYVRTAGYANPGDGGAALYKKVVAQPSHPGKFQSADGAWWEICELEIRPEMLGGGLAGSTDDTSSINNIISAATSQGVLWSLGPKNYIASNIVATASYVTRRATLSMKAGATGDLLKVAAADIHHFGDLILDGGDTTTYNGSQSLGTRNGFQAAAGCSGNRFGRMFAKGFTGLGIYVGALTNSYSEGVSFDYVGADTCFDGLHLKDRGEYVVVAAGRVSRCGTGVRIVGGNFNLNINVVTNYDGVKLETGASANDGHGTFRGCINHNSNWALYADSVTNGATFTGCEMFYGSVYLKNSSGINFIGGQLGSLTAVFVEGGGFHAWQNNGVLNMNGCTINDGYNSTISHLSLRGNYAAHTGDPDMAAKWNRNDLDIEGFTSIQNSAAALTINNAAPTTIVYPTAGISSYGVSDPSAYSVSTGVIAPRRAGDYNVACSAVVNNPTGGAINLSLWIDRAGTVAGGLKTISIPAGATISVDCFASFNVAAGTAITFKMQGSAAGLVLVTAVNDNHIRVRQVA